MIVSDLTFCEMNPISAHEPVIDSPKYFLQKRDFLSEKSEYEILNPTSNPKDGSDIYKHKNNPPTRNKMLNTVYRAGMN